MGLSCPATLRSNPVTAVVSVRHWQAEVRGFEKVIQRARPS